MDRKTLNGPEKKSANVSSDMRRIRIRIPVADTSVNEWWDNQVDPSIALRALIRDDIIRNGTSDLFSRPVVQQPRRGRPPGSNSVIEDEQAFLEQDSAPMEPQVTVRPPVVSDVRDEPAAPVAPVASAQPHQLATPEPTSSPSSQFDMDDIFGHASA